MRPLDVFFGIEFLACAVTCHVSDRAENRSLEPRTIVFTKAPQNAGVAIRVATVETILVV